MKKETGYEEVDTSNYSELLESITDEEWDEMEVEMFNNFNKKVLSVKKLNQDAVLPSYNYPSDSGFDLYSTTDILITPFGRALVPTGLSVQFEEGLEIQVRTKSGLAINQGLMVLNSPGTVDQGYTGEIQVIVFNTNNTTVTIPKGMKVGQGVLCPVVQGKFVSFEKVEQLENKDRGNNGFGSTGI